MIDPTLHLWKFVVPDDRWTPDPVEPDLSYRGCVAAAVAATEADARAHLERYAGDNGLDARWLRVARAVQLPLRDGVVACWAQV